MNTTMTFKMVAIDPRTALHLREATADEVAAYRAANEGKNHAFWKPVRVGDVLVDEWLGYGLWFGGAGF